MELKDFIAQTINEIIEGIVTAQASATPHGAMVNPVNIRNRSKDTGGEYVDDSTMTKVKALEVQRVVFDVAIVITRDEKAKVGGGVLTVVSGNLESGYNKQTTSRIKFSVPIVLPPFGHKLRASGTQARHDK